MVRRALLGGLATFVPGMRYLRPRGTGGTDSAEYCYSVWLRHLVLAHRNGLDCDPRTVVELGPGDSLGVGLAALLSGCEEYYAFDVVRYSSLETNMSIFERLAYLFQERAPIPDHREFPKIKPYLDSYGFPSQVLDDERLQRSLAPSRLDRIRRAILRGSDNEIVCKYLGPWDDGCSIGISSADMVISQSVLEYVDDLHSVYSAMNSWLKLGGFVSHQVDFGSVGTAVDWNGHWAYSDLMWRLMRGRRPYFPNRQPHSVHLEILREEGFEVVCDLPVKSASRLSVNDLAPRFRAMAEDDLVTSAAFIQAVKLR